MDRAKIDEARKAGYSDQEIADFMAASNPKIKTAREAGYSDSEIIDHLSPPPSLPRQALDAAGDFAGRAYGYARTLGNDALGHAIGLPRLALEGIDWLGRMDAEHGGVGTRVPDSVRAALPTAEQATAELNMPRPPITMGGLFNNEAYDKWRKEKDAGTLQPRPRLSSGSKVVDAAATGLLTAPFTGPASWPALFASTIGPATSELAGQATEGTSYEIPARLAGGLVGAAGGAAIPSVVRKGVDAGKAVVAPFTASGRDKIVGQTLFNLADDPAKAVAAGEAYSSPVPGFNLPAPQAMRDDALMATQNALNVPGSRYGQRVNANNVALSQELDSLGAGLDPRKFVAELAKQDAAAAARAQTALDALPPGVDAATAGQAIREALKGRQTALEEARATATKPLYDAARAYPEDLHVGPLFKYVDETIAGTKGDPQAAMTRARELLFDSKGRPDFSARGLDQTNKGLTPLISAAPDKYTKELLLGLRNRIEQTMSVIPEARQAQETFARMSRPLDSFSADQGAKGVAAALDEAPYTKAPLMPAEKVPGQFFRLGDVGSASMKEFMAANGGNQNAIDAMKSFVADKARASGDVKNFLQKHGPAIEALDPQLARQLEDAAATASISAGLRSGPAAKFLDGDLEAAVRSTLNAPDATKRMQTLRMGVGGEPEAVKGLQKAILNDFKSSVQLSVKESAQDVPALSADKASKWLTANKGAVSNVLTPDQVRGLEAITRALKDQAQTAVKTAGSDTSRNLATMSLLDAMLWNGAGGAAWLAPIRKTLNLAYGGANEQTLERLTEVLLDPKVAAALMKKATPGNAKMAGPVLESIGRGSLIGAAQATGAAQ